MTAQLQRMFVGLAALVAMSAAAAAAESDAEPRALPLIEPAIVHYRWTFVEPVWTIEPRRVDMPVVDPATRSKRIDYDTVEVTMERRRVGRIPEFSCKYSDFAWPNECRTTWRNLYADVPVAAVRRDHLDVEVPDWRLREARTIVDLPRLEWKRRELIVSVPAAAIYRDPPPVVPPVTVKEMR